MLPPRGRGRTPPLARVLCTAIWNEVICQPASQTIARLATTGMPRASARFLAGLGPLASGIA